MVEIMKKILAIGVIILFIFCNISFTTISYKNNGNLSGYVIDPEMNPVSGVKVTIECDELFF